MLLEEIAANRLELINATTTHLGHAARLRIKSDVDEVVDEAIRLMEWAHGALSIEGFSVGWSNILSARSIGGQRTCVREMGPSRFFEHPRLKVYALALQNLEWAAVLKSRGDALKFANDVIHVFRRLLTINSFALGHSDFGVRDDAPDGLDISVAKACMKQLGLTPGIIIE
jgi:hypothetical protein